MKVLTANPDGIAERNELGQSPLHLSAGWPSGIRILLEAAADTNRRDKAGLLPISYACKYDCLESVQLLISADSPISEIFEDAVHCGPRILSKVIVGLVDRRRRLEVMASKLPSEIYDTIAPRERKIVDECAIRMYEAILGKGSQVAPSLQPGPSGTVYHTPGLTAELCARLYRAGFLDIDGLDHRGLTPMMALRWMWLSFTEGLDIKEGLAITRWLIAKGANPLYTTSNRSPPALHYVAWGIGRRARGISRHIRSDATRTRRDLFTVLSSIHGEPHEMLRYLLNISAVDNCVCACSKKGCTTLVMILKAFSQFIGNSDYPWLWWSEVRLAVIEWLLDAVKNDEPMNQHLNDVMRFLTFQSLGLSHTCCRFQYKNLLITQPLNNEEVEELRDEESFMLQELEDLLAEAWENWNGSSMAVMDFLEEYSLQLAEKSVDEHPLALTSGKADDRGEEALRRWRRRGDEHLWMLEIIETVPRR